MRVIVKGTPKRRMKIKSSPKMQNGGIPTVNGLPDGLKHNANVEAEAGEVYEDTDGDINKISDNEKSHEQGGVMLDDVSRVLEDTSTSRKDKDSKKLAISPEDAELITGFKPKRKISHSKLLEEANEHYTKRMKTIESRLKKSLDVLDDNPADQFAKNSLNLNLSQLQNIPTKGELFDNLFDHQEGVKALHKVGDEYKKAKFGFYYPPKAKTAEVNQKKIYMQKYGGKPGKFKYQQGGDILQDYTGAKTQAGRYTPTGVDVNLTKDYLPLSEYKSAWQNVGLDLSGAKSIRDAQSQTYDYLLDKAPDVLRAMWSHYGNTAQGLQKKVLTDKYPKGVFSDPSQLTIEDLKKLKSAYTDEKLGPRRLVPGQDTTPDTVEGQVPPTPQAVPPVQQKYNFPPRTYNVTGNPKSDFNEPLQWYDVAGPIGAYLSATNRRRVPYNPMEFHQLHLQLQNPLPALQSGQTDYNAALASLATKGQGSGVANANVATLFGKKYQLNNEILGSYENINKNIKNQEIMYNTQVRDKQSAADQQARDIMEQRIAAGLEAQRLQKLTSLDDLYTRIAQNRRFNKEGNLIMKLAPAFDQNADYNGYKYIFRAPLNTPQTQPLQTVTTKSKGKTTNYVIINGVKYPIGE